MPSDDTDDDSKYQWSSAVGSRVDYSVVLSGDTDDDSKYQLSSAVGSRLDYSAVLSGDTDDDSKYTWNSTVGSSVVGWSCAIVARVVPTAIAYRSIMTWPTVECLPCVIVSVWRRGYSRYIPQALIRTAP